MTDALPRTVLQSLNKALHQALADNPQVVLLGEDILDPYGGSFKVDRGLSTAFPDQIFTTPISEAGIAGLAGGMALRGMRPVVEIMFGDFVHPDRGPGHQSHRQIPRDVQWPGERAGVDPHPDGRPPRLRSHSQPDPGKALPRYTGVDRPRAVPSAGEHRTGCARPAAL